ncbi:MAG: response regulator [Saonia sp.]
MKSNNYVLLVEDNPNDIFLMRRVFDIDLLEYSVIVFDKAHQAIAFLNERKNNNHLPNLVLLDIKLLAGNGFDVLEHIKNDAILKKIPTVMMSSSDRQDDKQKASDLGCDAYFEKLRTYVSLKQQLPMIIDSWAIDYENDFR